MQMGCLVHACHRLHSSPFLWRCWNQTVRQSRLVDEIRHISTIGHTGMQGSAQKYTHGWSGQWGSMARQHSTNNAAPWTQIQTGPVWLGQECECSSSGSWGGGGGVREPVAPLLLANEPKFPTNSGLWGEKQESWEIEGCFRPPATLKQMTKVPPQGQLWAVSTKVMHFVLFWIHCISE